MQTQPANARQSIGQAYDGSQARVIYRERIASYLTFDKMYIPE
jgi:hypothetical protein